MFIADRAVVFYKRHPRHYLPVLRAAMRRKKPREHKVFSADFALKRLLAGMEVFVLDRVRADGKSFIADVAFVFRFSLVRFNVHFEVVLRSARVLAHVARKFLIVTVFNRVQTELYVVWKSLITNLAVYGFVFVRRRYF